MKDVIELTNLRHDLC